jgi:arylsulfatase A-like enzyme
MAALAESGQDRNTLVIFISDNGGPTSVNASSNRPLRGFKGEMWEGGLRVPLLARWPGHLPAGRVIGHPVISLDLLPTILAATGIPADAALEGRDLQPLMTGSAVPTPRALGWRMGEMRAVRVGDWKLVDMGQGPELYDLASDAAETTNLAGRQPEKLAELEAAYGRWNLGNIRPLWPSPPKGSN